MEMRHKAMRKEYRITNRLRRVVFLFVRGGTIVRTHIPSTFDACDPDAEAFRISRRQLANEGIRHLRLELVPIIPRNGTKLLATLHFRSVCRENDPSDHERDADVTDVRTRASRGTCTAASLQLRRRRNRGRRFGGRKAI